MKWPTIVVPRADASTSSLVVRLMWMAIIWIAGVACVLGVSVVLRSVLRR